MHTPGKCCLAALLLLLLASGCSSQVTRPQNEVADAQCHVIFDAGSKGTRLYIYEQSESGWLKHSGPETGALADPVRTMRGKSMADAETVVDNIINMLEQIRTEGPPGPSGTPRWPGFDWRQLCNVQSASLFATAGMRLAELNRAEDSKVLWHLLNGRLSREVAIEATTRTLSGFEEGLFAWLAIAGEQPNLNFGMAEMGGASMQITFPCSSCDVSRQVRVLGDEVPIYSHSFLGWGQDEAWNKFGDSMACKLGAAKEIQTWDASDCSAGIDGFSQSAMQTRQSIQMVAPERWYLSDAFRYMKDDDIERYCQLGDDTGYEPESACFRAIYLEMVLKTLGLPVDARHSNVDWTLGAVICTATRCLEVE